LRIDLVWLGEDEDSTDIISVGTSVESITVTALPEVNLPPSEEQIRVIRRFIQTAYRSLLRRRRKSTKSTLEATRASFFDVEY
jgi:hypothetical protein